MYLCVHTHIKMCVYVCPYARAHSVLCVGALQALELFATLGEATGVQGDGNLNVVLDLRDHYSHEQPQKFRNSQYFFFFVVV